MSQGSDAELKVHRYRDALYQIAHFSEGMIDAQSAIGVVARMSEIANDALAGREYRDPLMAHQDIMEQPNSE